ncbi:Chalcone isomerase protein [Dioscorea alata]|uniref:Chalcone isomerase protein n=1 Tax=Dioscorea alata TaxID=55571 RepID=A0ACB7UDN4_DIOAL|nr:Chalcone isomerase protein [Dioscorea alata]
MVSMITSSSPTAPPPSYIPKCMPKTPSNALYPQFPHKFPSISSSHHHLTNLAHNRLLPLLTPKASVGSAEYIVEPGTSVSFSREIRVPGCPESLVLLGTGFREKVFAIIGVKVYAAGFYVASSVKEKLDSWRGKQVSEKVNDSTLFTSIFTAPLQKSLKIVLVRDVDGKTFWNALNDVILPRIKEPSSADEFALSTFRDTFQKRDLKNGTLILLTWVEPSKMLVSISSDGFPSSTDAVIESENVTMALFDGYFGDSPVSPTLKSSVADGIAVLLN